ncbi:MAG TPA: hypothetical protein PK156_37345 [Polyangium sp.]|nr:hypothetical protein [Polyangium sp.]
MSAFRARVGAALADFVAFFFGVLAAFEVFLEATILVAVDAFVDLIAVFEDVDFLAAAGGFLAVDVADWAFLRE